MSLPALASIDSLVAMLGGPTGAELARAKAVLDLASIEVRFVAREDWVTNGEPPELVDDVPPIVTKITLEVAQRAFLKPADGTRQESLGDHAKTYDNRQGVYLTEEEKAKVRAAAAGEDTPSGLWTLSTTRGCDDIFDVTEFIAVDPTGDPIPYRSYDDPGGPLT